MRTFTVHVINVKTLPYARIVEKPLYTWNVLVLVLFLVLIVECVRIVHHSRLLDWIESGVLHRKIQAHVSP